MDITSPPATCRSQYVAMRDGTRLAVDVWLPTGHSDAVPRFGAVVRATRYWRAAVGAADTSAHEGEIALFAARRLALVTVDVRGTGASFGRWDGPWSSTELDDLGEVVAWVSRQPWSNGRIGTHGVSYDGNTAELIGTLGNPAVVAACPRFADYDPWAHLALPGGVLLESFLTAWAAGNRALDLDAPGLVASSPAEAEELRAWFGHPKPVDGDDGTLIAEAVQAHAANLDLLATVSQVDTFDDAASRMLGYPQSAPYSRREQARAAGTQLRHVGSWYDAGTAAGVLARFASANTPQRAVIGAWSHGGHFDASPFAVEAGLPAVPTIEVQRQELAAWLADRLAADAAPITGKVLTYRTVGTETWHTTDVWPPAGVQPVRSWLTADGGMSAEHATDGTRRYVVDPLASSGADTNRWQTQEGQRPVHYADRADADARCLVWTGPALADETTITGTPVLHLQLATTAADGALHAYLEAVAPDGRVVYLTEGILRLAHRAVGPAPYVVDGPYHPCTGDLVRPMTPGRPEPIDLALFPVSAAVPAGWSIRVAIAGADHGTFRPVALDADVTWTVASGPDGSWIDVPVDTVVREAGR